MTSPLEPETVRTWASAAVAALGEARPALDAANVFPVPDGDTGTNLLLTFREGLAAIEAADDAGARRAADVDVDADADADADPAAETDVRPDAGALLAALARGCALGARGNSGVIVAQWVGGLAEVLGGPEDDTHDDERGRRFAGALDAAARAARDSVAQPVEGTVLTAASAAAAAALSIAQDGASDADVLAAATRAATDAYVRSAAELDALAGTGLRDAGAHGFVVVLAALARAIGGRVEVPAVSVVPGTIVDTAPPVAGGELEVMFTLVADVRPGGARGHDADAAAAVARGRASDPGAAVRDALAAVGNSVAVVGSAPLWRAHVHTDDPVAALDAGARAGRVDDAQVRYLTVGHGRGERPRVVAVCSAPALAAEVARAGAVVVVPTDGAVSDVALHRAADECGSPPVLLAPRAVLGALADDAFSGLVEAATDLHVVAALAALATLGPVTADRAAGAPTGAAPDGTTGTAEAPGGRLAELFTRAVEGVRVVAVHDAGAPGPVPADALDHALDALGLLDDAAAEPGDVVVLVLHGALVDVETVRDAVVGRRPGAEIVALASGREDAGLLVGLDRAAVAA